MNRAGGKKNKRAFLMSLEAASAFMLVLIAAAAIPAFTFQKDSAPQFFLCSDAAMSLVRSGAFADQASLEAQFNKIMAVGGPGICIEASSPAASVPSPLTVPCEPSATSDKYVFSLPVFQDGHIVDATVSCLVPSPVSRPVPS